MASRRAGAEVPGEIVDEAQQLTTAAEPIYLDTTTWYGAVRHLADPSTGHAAPDTGREEFTSLCHQSVMAQETFTAVRRANAHRPVFIHELPMCTACEELKSRGGQPPKTPEQILEEMQS